MGSMSLFAQDRLTVDLSTLPAIRNEAAFTKQYDDFLVRFPAWPANINWSNFNRIIVRAKYFGANGNEIRQDNDLLMVVLIYDPDGDIRGPGSGPGPNTPLKVFNVGGNFTTIHTNRGVALSLDKAPGAILFQNLGANVRFVEIQEITFFKN